MTDSYLAKYAPRLLSLGYSIVPIRQGSKAPEGDAWQTTKATPALVKKWITAFPKGGVGILTRDTPLVDIDVIDREAAEHMTAYVQEWYGPAPVRIGKAPKTGLLFRTEKPFRKVQSAVWLDEFYTEKGDPTHKVEILGEGQQFVAFHVHKDTKKPYTWPDGDPPNAADLPVITEEMARKIVAEFDRYAAQRGWRRKTGVALARPSAPGRQIDHNDVFATDKSRIEDMSEDQIAERLMLVPGAEDYDTWFQIGMALYHQFEGSERGLELWHEWSQTALNYSVEACDAKWPTFEIEGKGRAPVTARVILRMAKEAAQEIAVEKFAAIKLGILESTDTTALKAVCDEAKTIRFEMLQRHEIVGLVQQAYKRITKASLPIGAAREMVRFENPELKDAPFWLKPFVHVANGNIMWSKKRRTAYGMPAFDAQHNRFMLTPTERLEGKAQPETRASEFALNVVQIETVVNAIYMPGQDDVFEFNGQPVVNTYSDYNVPQTPDRLTRKEREAVEMVQSHFVHLFASERDRRVLLDGIAYIVQNPGERINFGFLLQGTEGDGKTVFARLMSSVLGGDNVKSVPAQALEEKFNPWSEGAQAIFVEEIKLQGHNRYDVLNKVKPLLTNKTISIRKMNTDIYEAPNTATYFLLTNFVDALPLGEGDSRYFVLFSRFQTQEAINAFNESDPTYYDRLHDAIDTYGGALRKWLLEHEISPEFNPKRRAPPSEAKNRMVNYNLTEEEEAIIDIVENSPHLDISKALLNVTKLQEIASDEGVQLPYGRALNSLLIKLGWRKLDRVRITGSKDPALMWSQNPERFYHSDGKVNPHAIRSYLDSDL